GESQELDPPGGGDTGQPVEAALLGNTTRLAQDGDGIIQATPRESLPRRDLVCRGKHVEPPVGGLDPGVNEGSRGIVVALEIQTITYEKAAEGFQAAVGAEVTLGHREGFAIQRLRLTQPTRQQLAQGEVHESVVDS